MILTYTFFYFYTGCEAEPVGAEMLKREIVAICERVIVSFAITTMIVLSSYGQQSYYHAYSTGTYTNLSGSTSLNNGQIWEDPEYHIAIGFNFDFFGTVFDSIYVSDYVWFDENIKYSILAYYADFIDRSTTSSVSPISYLLTGSPGTQILKIEWNNAGFREEFISDSTFTDYINVQLWLYESTNNIEVRIGPNSVLKLYSYDNGSGGYIAMLNLLTPEELYLTGQPDATVMTVSFNYLSATPVDGAVYLLTQCINPIAAYNYSVDSNLLVTFSNSPPSATYYYWDFGDSTTSNVLNPTHTYADTGTYMVDFVVSANCDTDTLSQLVCIYIPSTDFTFSFSDPQTNFSSLNNNAVSYFWDFGDSTTATGQNVSHIFSDTGMHTIVLAVDFGCGPDTLTKTISVLVSGLKQRISDQKIINIYPNPNNGLFNIEVNYRSENLIMSIMDVTGRTVINSWVHESNGHKILSMDISNLKESIYYLIIEDGNTRLVKKLIVY